MLQSDHNQAYGILILRLIDNFCSFNDDSALQFLLDIVAEIKNTIPLQRWDRFFKSYLRADENVVLLQGLEDALNGIKIKADLKAENKNQLAFAVLVKFFEQHRSRETIPKIVLPGLLQKMLINFLKIDNTNEVQIINALTNKEQNLNKIMQDKWDLWCILQKSKEDQQQQTQSTTSQDALLERTQAMTPVWDCLDDLVMLYDLPFTPQAQNNEETNQKQIVKAENHTAIARKSQSFFVFD